MSAETLRRAASGIRANMADEFFLAVADLLDGYAERWDAGELGRDEWNELSAVARAYLGETA